VDASDALAILRYGAGMAVTQNEPCPDIGLSSVDQDLFGDVDCDDDVDSVDGLLVLRFTAGLPVDLPPGCPPVGPAMPTPRPTPTPPPGTPTPIPTKEPALVTLRNSGWHLDTNGIMMVAGEIVNESDRPVGLVRVEASLYSASGELLKTGAGYSCLSTVPAAGDSPYEIMVFGPPGDVDHVTLKVAKFFDPPFIPAPTGLQGQVTNVYTDLSGLLHAAGTVTNNSSTGYKLVKACIAFYNERGEVYRSKYSFTTPNIMGPGGMGAFDTSIKPAGATITSERVWPDAMPQ
jgi:hypothetical protein